MPADHLDSELGTAEDRGGTVSLAFGASPSLLPAEPSPPHPDLALLERELESLRPVFQVMSFQWVTGMCVHAKENIKMFGECFRKIAQSRLPSLAYRVLFSFLFALCMCDPHPGAFCSTALAFLTPTVLSYSGEDIQFSTNNTEQ